MRLTVEHSLRIRLQRRDGEKGDSRVAIREKGKASSCVMG